MIFQLIKLEKGDIPNSEDIKSKQEEIKQDDLIGHTFYKEITSLQKSNSFYKRLVLFLLLIITIAMFFIGYLGSLSKTDLAVVHTSGDNQIINVSMANPLSQGIANSDLATYFIEQFITNARSVSVDQIVDNNMQIKAYSYLQGQAQKAFKEYLNNNNKFKIAKKDFVEVSIKTVLPNVGGVI